MRQLYEIDSEAYADLGAVYFRNLGIGISEPGTEPQNDSCAVMNKESIEFIIKDMPRYQP